MLGSGIGVVSRVGMLSSGVLSAEVAGKGSNQAELIEKKRSLEKTEDSMVKRASEDVDKRVGGSV
jgi:hypothetical protein